jgi:hypothetical protein
MDVPPAFSERLISLTGYVSLTTGLPREQLGKPTKARPITKWNRESLNEKIGFRWYFVDTPHSLTVNSTIYSKALTWALLRGWCSHWNWFLYIGFLNSFDLRDRTLEQFDVGRCWSLLSLRNMLLSQVFQVDAGVALGYQKKPSAS